MKLIHVFKRREFKYLIHKEQKRKLMQLISENMKPDEYGEEIIGSIYFDTDNDLLIRNSMRKPQYKEKLRLRAYGEVKESDEIFIELKKKYKNVVYKRRELMKEKEAMALVAQKPRVAKSGQIIKEMEYFIQWYKTLAPKMYISCKREAFHGKTDDLRVTFDSEILWRNYDVSFAYGHYGDTLLEEDMVLMEIKAPGAMPLWLVNFLTENAIFRTSFSKYKNAYILSKQGENMAKTAVKANVINAPQVEKYGVEIKERQPVPARI